MSAEHHTVEVYAKDKLAGLMFWTERQRCVFRADCGFDFNHPLDASNDSYVVVDPETDQAVGIQSPTGFTGNYIPPVYRVYLLRPLLPPFNLTTEELNRLSTDEMKAMIRETFEMMRSRGLL